MGDDMDSLATALFGVSEDVRYIALYRFGELELHQRPGIRNASASESDRYEELLVNPALLTLARQRGEIDCGGMEYLLIRYGSFFTLLYPIEGGHVNVGLETTADPLALLGAIRAALVAHGATVATQVRA